APPAEVEAGGNYREDAGSVNRIRDQVRAIRHEHADGDLDGAIVDPALEPIDDEAEHQADADSASDEIAEAEEHERGGRNLSPGEQQHAHLDGEQAGRVVDQALAFEDVHDAAWEPHVPGDRGRGDGVGG